MTDRIEGPYAEFEPVTDRRAARKVPVRTALIGAALLALGVGGGATVAQMTGPSVEMAPLNPVAIRSLSDTGSVVSVRGKVAEIYGPMVVLADGSGRALVELGPQGDGTGLVSAGQAVTVQGRFGRGMLHASFLVAADGKVVALRPLGPPPHGPGGPGGPGDFRRPPRDGMPGAPGGPGAAGAERGPDAGPDGATPPPPPAAAAPGGLAPAAPTPAAPAAPAPAR